VAAPGHATCCFFTSHRAHARARSDRCPEALEQAPENPIPPPPAQRLNATKKRPFLSPGIQPPFPKKTLRGFRKSRD
jgi:hypothetical protein